MKAANVTRADLAEAVRICRSEGWTYRRIAVELGISLSYANDLTVDPTGEKAAARKRSYAGVCMGCGTATTGCNGREQAPEWCSECRPSVDAYWSPEAIIEAVRAFHAEHGRTPVASECHLRNGLPTVATLAKHFGSLNGAAQVAGFAGRGVGQKRSSLPMTQERVVGELQAVAVDGVLPLWFWTTHSSIASRIGILFPGGAKEAYAAAGVRAHGKRRKGGGLSC